MLQTYMPTLVSSEKTGFSDMIFWDFEVVESSENKYLVFPNKLSPQKNGKCIHVIIRVDSYWKANLSFL